MSGLNGQFNARLHRLEETERTRVSIPVPNVSDDGKSIVVNDAGEYELEDIHVNVDEFQTQLDVINARIDNIVALPEGSTSGDAELADIRVAANGTIYSTAGDAVRGQVDNLKTLMQTVTPVMRNGSISNTSNANGITTNLVLPTNGAKRVRVTTTKHKAASGNKFLWVVAFYTQAGGGSSADTYRIVNVDPWLATSKNYIDINVENYVGFSVAMFESDGTNLIAHRIENDGNCLNISYFYDIKFDTIPSMSNGTMGNPSNTNCVKNNLTITLPKNFSYIRVELKNNTGVDLDFYYTLWVFNEDNIMSSKYQSKILQIDEQAIDGNVFYIPASIFSENAKSYSFTFFAYLNGTLYPLRYFNVEDFCHISYVEELPDETNELDRKIKNKDVFKKIKNARHKATNPLTLLHLSDIHADTAALKRIMDDAESFGDSIDEMICTGDMVANSNGAIASWWNANVLTCIGNHDSASYSNGVYNWTALSMANRDAYYIAPFEENWNIIHTSGKSYYYKDYIDAKVRLIVMDVMLYTDAGQDATDQTTWLTNLLADAITNNLHVLIAIHAPHGGAVAKDCSFDKFNQINMPTLTDCNTPQGVIDVVAAKISAGLKFIGYLVGHTHQDDIWDVEGDGKQLMYCVTCAAVTQTAQWNGSDQYRSESEDAYNLVTIDTTNTLVKIVRGGGADIDDHMRTRKAICFNYTNGEIVGEVL